MYRLAAFDLDGTLLNSKNTISDGNAKALAGLAERGVTIVASTARAHESAMRQFWRHGLAPATVCCAGADVRLADGTVVKQWPLPQEFVEFIAEISDRVGWTATLSTADATFRREHPAPSWAATPRPGLFIVPNLAGVDLTGLLSALIQPGDESAALAELDAWSESISISRALSFNGEAIITATSRETDKGVGLRTLCKRLVIPSSEVVAFGDSSVDLPLFRDAGFSVAVANATPDVLKVADLVTASADDDGVARAIEQLWG